MQSVETWRFNVIFVGFFLLVFLTFTFSLTFFPFLLLFKIFILAFLFII